MQTPTEFKVQERDLITKTDNMDSNLYFASFSKHFTFGKLIEIIKNKGLRDDLTDDFKTVRVLRNKVMHHTVLLLSHHTEKELVDDEICLNLINLARYPILDLQSLLNI